MAGTPPEATFVTLCGRILDSLSAMVKDARDAGLSDVDPTALDTARSMLRAVPPSDLVVSFIKKKEHWNKIHNKDMNFLKNEVGLVFAGAGILKKEVIDEPVRVYLQLKKWKEDPSTRPPATKKAIDYEKPFIDDEDMDVLWTRFNGLIKLSCRWNLDNKNKYDLSPFYERYGLVAPVAAKKS